MGRSALHWFRSLSQRWRRANFRKNLAAKLRAAERNHGSFLVRTCAPVRSTVPHPQRDVAGGVPERLHNAGHGLRTDLLSCAAEAEACLDEPSIVENRCSNAARTEIVFFVINGITLASDFLQFFEQPRQRGDGLRSPLFHTALAQNLLQPILCNMRDQSFSHARGMHAHPPTDPGIHPDESLRLNFLDVDRIGSIENCQMEVSPVWWVRWRMMGRATPRTSSPLSAPRLKLRIFNPTRYFPDSSSRVK